MTKNDFNIVDVLYLYWLNKQELVIPDTQLENLKLKATFCTLLKAWSDIVWDGQDKYIDAAKVAIDKGWI